MPPQAQMSRPQAPGIVIAGAGLAGLRSAEQLRARGWTGPLTVVGAEAHLPYNRPPLTKEALREGPALAGVELRRRSSVADVDWQLGRRVEAVDLDARTVLLDDGGQLGYDGLVVATGVSPRRLPLPDPAPHVLRTLDDAAGLHAELTPGRRLVVIGAGFVGCEVAASASDLGLAVTVVDPLPTPLLAQLGAQLGAEMSRRHQRHAIQFRLGRTVTGIEAGAGAQRRVHLDDGSVLVADVVVQAVGSVPNTAFLQGQRLDLSDGVLCDQDLHPLREGRALLDVVVVGDVARLPLAAVGGPARRIEHWAMAVDTAAHAAPSLLAGLDGKPANTPFTAVPSFWSEQHGVRIHCFGVPGAGIGDIRILAGDLGGEVALGYHDEHGLVAVVVLGLTRELMHYRALLLDALTERPPARG